MHTVSTNFAKALVWKHQYDVKLQRHKQRKPNTNYHHMPLNEIPPMKFFRVRHSKEVSFPTSRFRISEGATTLKLPISYLVVTRNFQPWVE